MEVNQVLINLKDYNDLRDFKKAIEADHSIEITTSSYWSGSMNIGGNFTTNNVIISKDDVVKKLENSLKSQKNIFDQMVKDKDQKIDDLRVQLGEKTKE